jgi:hypothetical protein
MDPRHCLTGLQCLTLHTQSFFMINSVNVWREEMEIKATRKMKEERQSARRHQKPRYHHASGKCIKHYSDGWTNAGKEYYAELHKQYKTLKESQMWTILQGHWKTYQMKVYHKHNKQELCEGKEQTGFHPVWSKIYQKNCLLVLILRVCRMLLIPT